MMNKKGFSLAELLMVIVILGILGGIALPRFFPKQEKAKVAEAIGILSAMRTGQLAYHLETNNWITQGQANQWDLLGLDAPPTTNFVYTIEANGVGLATRAAGVPTYGGKTIRLFTNGTWDEAATHPLKPKNV